MVSKKIVINNDLGIHLRPAGKLADAGCTIPVPFIWPATESGSMGRAC